MSHPFQSIPKEKKPSVFETDYHTDGDEYIITYDVVSHVKLTGDKDTDFVINDEVTEIDRVKRQDYINSFESEVGILNIREKVRMSGDVTLYNQTHRVGYDVVGNDALGHPVEKVVDVTDYQVDITEALSSYKKGAESFASLDPELKKKLTMEQVAMMSDAEIDAFLNNRIAAINAANKKEGEE